MSNNDVSLSSIDIAHSLPEFSSFSSYFEKIDGSVEESFKWVGEIGEYTVEMVIQRQATAFSWGGKAHIQSICGVVLDRVEVLPAFETVEQAYLALCQKLDERLTKMEKSHITGAFPFIA